MMQHVTHRSSCWHHPYGYVMYTENVDMSQQFVGAWEVASLPACQALQSNQTAAVQQQSSLLGVLQGGTDD
jgi:hypothetical protein